MRTMSRNTGPWIAMVALTAILGGCSNDGERNGTSGYGDNGKNGAREGAMVEITSSHTFTPREVTIRSGEAVTWKNMAKEVHTVTADPARVAKREHTSLPAGAKPFHSGEIHAGKTWRQTFTTPGTYRYVCMLHEDHGMMGTVVVRPSDSGTPSPY